jgi:predicted Zn-dependent peptidase
MKASRIHPGTVSAKRLYQHAIHSVLLVVIALFASTVPTAVQLASHRLANGLEIIVIPATTPSLTVVTRYFAGSEDEPDSLRGLAHLVEHLAMREASGGTALAVLAARNGWNVGAFTQGSVTTFSTTSSVDDSATLAAMLRLERSRMSDLAMDSAAVNVERRRIATEIGASNDRIVAHRDLDRITPADARTFWRRFYVPGNTLITVETALPAAAVIRIVERELARVPGGTVPSASARRERARTAAVREATSRTVATSASSAWLAPDTVNLRWQSMSAVQYAAAPGGRSDTVFFAVWIAAPPTLSVSDVAAVELLARTFGELRLPNGHSVITGITALGGSLTVRSLPYPPLATADPFRMLGTRETPIGLVGLQLLGSAPRQNARGTLQVLSTALAGGRPDSASVAVEVQKQLELLSQAAESNPANLEVEFRRSLPVLPTEPTAVWRPEMLSEQRRTMERHSSADVERLLGTLVRNGTTRVALLGVEPIVAADWLSEWPSPEPTARARADSGIAGCARREVDPVSAGRLDNSANVYFALCIPEGAPGGNVSIPLQVASAILGNREDALLASRLRGGTGLAYSFENRVVPVWEGGRTLWYLRIGTSRTTVEDAIREVRSVLVAVARDGVPDNVIADFREWLARRQLARAVDGTEWVEALVATGLSPEQMAVRIRAVTTHDVQATWKYWEPTGLMVVAPSVRR